MLAAPGDGRWFERIDNAEEIEHQQWQEFEHQFRPFHEETLPYRFLQETDEQCEIVVKAFPEVSIDGKKGALTLNYERIQFHGWPAPIPYRDVSQLLLNEGTLEIKHGPSGKQKQKIRMNDFGGRQQEALDAIDRYYSR
jgi:hypothetical protein